MVAAPTIEEGSLISTSSPTFFVLFYPAEPPGKPFWVLFDDSHSGRYEGKTPSGFDLRLPDD